MQSKLQLGKLLCARLNLDVRFVERTTRKMRRNVSFFSAPSSRCYKNIYSSFKSRCLLIQCASKFRMREKTCHPCRKQSRLDFLRCGFAKMRFHRNKPIKHETGHNLLILRYQEYLRISDCTKYNIRRWEIYRRIYKEFNKDVWSKILAAGLLYPKILKRTFLCR